MPKPSSLGVWPSTPPPAHKLVKVIRFLATQSDRIDWTDHAWDRMDERGITDMDALRALRNGDIVGSILAGRRRGEWQCKVCFPLRERREIGVAVVVVESDRMVIKTVEWEDPA